MINFYAFVPDLSKLEKSFENLSEFLKIFKDFEFKDDIEKIKTIRKLFYKACVVIDYPKNNNLSNLSLVEIRFNLDNTSIMYLNDFEKFAILDLSADSERKNLNNITNFYNYIIDELFYLTKNMNAEDVPNFDYIKGF